MSPGGCVDRTFELPQRDGAPASHRIQSVSRHQGDTKNPPSLAVIVIVKAGTSFLYVAISAVSNHLEPFDEFFNATVKGVFWRWNPVASSLALDTI